jgi:hemerythrin-like domain-containing protein
MEEEIRIEREKIKNNATIYDILKQEHKDVKKLFKQIVDENRYQDDVYMQIKNALAMHMAGEEKLFYSRLENNPETRELVLESFEEHDVGKKVINDIDNSADDDAKLAKVKVLREAIDQHFEEEEGSLFKKAKKVLSNEEEREIARQFMTDKMQNMSKPTNMPSAARSMSNM